jgi:MoxR-like ATPase
MEMNKVIVGQKHMVERLLIGLLGQGHILLEGVPGLAKTLAINTLSQAVQGSFSRIQFTPDLLPADVVGTMIYNIKANEFSIKKGPIFANFVLADEINRAPAKVQSALLEAMAEKQVTIGDKTHKLPTPFVVLATQNPIEQEGTYNLPEAQLDRFMMKVHVDYPDYEAEKSILQMKYEALELRPILHQQDFASIKAEVERVFVDENALLLAFDENEFYIFVELLFDNHIHLDDWIVVDVSMRLLDYGKISAIINAKNIKKCFSYVAASNYVLSHANYACIMFCDFNDHFVVI